MNVFADAFAWLFSPDRLTGSLPLPLAIWQHLAFTFGAVAIAAATQVEQLGDALDTRTLIGQATGLLMATYDLPADAAFAALARTSQTTNTKLRDLAAEVVRTRRLPDA